MKTKTIKRTRPYLCTVCGGNGTDPRPHTGFDCSECDGKNAVKITFDVPDSVTGGWTGDLGDDCFLKTADGYVAHAEATGINAWCCQVTLNNLIVFDSSYKDIRLFSGEAARWLCEAEIDADRWRRG